MDEDVQLLDVACHQNHNMQLSSCQDFRADPGMLHVQMQRPWVGFSSTKSIWQMTSIIVPDFRIDPGALQVQMLGSGWALLT